jgi:hypothetical protein
MADRPDRLRLVDPAADRVAVAELLPKIVEQLRQLADVAAALAVREGARFGMLGASCRASSWCSLPPGAGWTEAR